MTLAPEQSITVVPWANLQPLDLLGRVKALQADSRLWNVIDWGCGLNHSPVSAQVREMECRTLVSVDAWPEYLPTIRQQSYRAERHFVIEARVQDFARALRKNDYPDWATLEVWPVELSLCLDVVEHLEKPEAEDFLRHLQEFSGAILVWIPLGYAPIAQDTYGGSNHFWHTHRSTWEAADLERLGFAVEVLPDFHTAMFGWPVAAGWACWKEGESCE